MKTNQNSSPAREYLNNENLQFSPKVFSSQEPVNPKKKSKRNFKYMKSFNSLHELDKFLIQLFVCRIQEYLRPL